VTVALGSLALAPSNAVPPKGNVILVSPIPAGIVAGYRLPQAEIALSVRRVLPAGAVELADALPKAKLGFGINRVLPLGAVSFASITVASGQVGTWGPPYRQIGLAMQGPAVAKGALAL